MSDLYSSSQAEVVYAQIAGQLQQQGYCILPCALPQSFVVALIEQLAGHREFKSAGVGRAELKHKNRQIRGDKISWIDADTPINAAWLQWCEALRVFLNHQLFLGLHSCESHYALYQPGDFYQRHLDVFRTSPKNKHPVSQRIVSMVTYLNHDWPDNGGGELVLYDLADNILGRVVPEAGTLVVFLSDEFPHEVLPATCERLSIASWFRSR